MEVSKVESVVCDIVKASLYENVKLTHVKKEFEATTKIRLKDVASHHGFMTISGMIRSWKSFKISGYGLLTSICLEAPLSADRNGDRISQPAAVDQAVQRLSELAISPTFINKIDKVVPQRMIAVSSTSIPIVLLHSINPSCFWFCELEEHQQLKALEVEMATFYEEQGKQLKISGCHLQPWLHVAVKSQNKWHRAKIVKLEKSIRARVFFIDSGVADDVSIDEHVRYLRNDFAQLPATAHRGILSYVKPKDDAWNKDSIRFMEKRCGQQFQAKIHQADENGQIYFQSIKKDGEQQQFLDSLIQQGSCFLDTSFPEQNELTNIEDFIYYEDGLHLDSVDDDDWLPKTPEPCSNKNARPQIRGLQKIAKKAPKSDTTPVTLQSPPAKTQKPTPKTMKPETVQSPPKATQQRKFVMPEKRTRLEMPPKVSLTSRLKPLKVPQIKEFGPMFSSWNEPSSATNATPTSPPLNAQQHKDSRPVPSTTSSCNEPSSCMKAAQVPTSQPVNAQEQKYSGPAPSTTSSWNERAAPRMRAAPTSPPLKAAPALTTPERKEPLKSSVINNRLQQRTTLQVSQPALMASTSTAPIPTKPSVQVFEQPSAAPPEKKKESTCESRQQSDVCTRKLGVQDLTKLEIGSKAEIVVNVVSDRMDFYFFFKEDLLRHVEFLDRFNFIYRKSCNPPHDFAIGTGVVTFDDDNYCRGRIIEQLGENLLKILLIDFGMVVVRQKKEVFRLEYEYWLYPAAVYHGQLANIPEHVGIQTPEDLLARTREDGRPRAVKIQIVRIVGTKVELRLLN